MTRVVALVLLAAVALALLKVALIALMIGAVLALLLAFVQQPGNTIALLVAVGLTGLISARPLACVVAFGVVAIVVVVVGSLRRARKPLLLTDQREQRSN